MAGEQLQVKAPGSLVVASTPIADDDLFLISRTGIVIGRIAASDVKAYAAGGAPVQSVAGKTGIVTLVKADVGLGSVDNTSDLIKPVSTAQQAALDLKAPINNPTFTGTVGGVSKSMVGLGNVDNTSNATERAAIATLTNKTISADTNTISDLEADNFKAGAIDAAVNPLIAAYVAAQDVEVLKGAIDCSASPNYPAADAGHVYRVSVAGKIGGASGVSVEVGDRLECFVDSSASGDQVAVGANWLVSQVNIDGAVVGPASATDSHLALFDGGSGKIIKSGGVTSSFGRGLIALADAAALRTAGELGRFRGVVTYAQLLALSGNLQGDTAYVTNAGGLWSYTGTLWMVVSGGYRHFQRSGRLAAPLATIAAGSTAEQVFAIAIPDFPAYLFRADSQLSVEWAVRKIGATANTYNTICRLGTAGTTADSSFFLTGSVAGAPHVQAVRGNTIFDGSNNIVSYGSISYAGASGTPVDRSANINLAAAMKLTLSVQPTDVTDSFSLLAVSVIVRP